MPCDGNIDVGMLQLTVTKLLDKAGFDARLTPRLLREKVEQRMKLEPDALKSMKPEIMAMITDWWIETHGNKRKPRQVSALESLSKLAKAVGKGPHFFKSLNFTSDSEKADDIRKRLCDEGYEISKIPSDAEIEDARRKYALKKEVSDIDQSLILTNGKRRLDEQTGSSGDDKILKEARASGEPAPAVIPNENEEVRSASKKMKLSQDTGEDEEAEAQF